MPNIESTAVNALIHLINNKPLVRESSEDLLFRAPRSAVVAPAPPPVARVAPARAERVSAPDSLGATLAVHRQAAEPLIPRHLVAPIAILAAVAIGLGGYLGLRGAHPSKAEVAAVVVPAPTIVAPKLPPPAPLVAPIAPKVVAPKLVDVRLDSEPAGATVTLDDRGATSLLGTTPVSASLDPSRAYNVVFTLDGHATQRAQIDPATTQHVAIALADNTPKPVVAVVAHHAAKQGGTGLLMVSSKPPCEIIVDGKPTGLTAPQKSIPLAAGSHRITLVNARRHINKTLGVKINAGHSTKLIHNFMI